MRTRASWRSASMPTPPPRRSSLRGPGLTFIDIRLGRWMGRDFQLYGRKHAELVETGLRRFQIVGMVTLARLPGGAALDRARGQRTLAAHMGDTEMH